MYTTKEFRTRICSYYEENGIVVGDPSEGNWERAHVVPQCKGGTETVLLLHGHHCYHDLIQSKEYNHPCFFAGTTRAWLYGEGFLCEHWFELVELYEYYSSRHSTRIAADRWATLTPEERSAEMSRRQNIHWTTMTPEERSAEMGRRVSEGWAQTTPEERRAALAPAHAANKARWAAMTPEERSAQMRRCQAGRKAKVRAERALRSLGADLHGAMWADEAV